MESLFVTMHYNLECSNSPNTEQEQQAMMSCILHRLYFMADML